MIDTIDGTIDRSVVHKMNMKALHGADTECGLSCYRHQWTSSVDLVTCLRCLHDLCAQAGSEDVSDDWFPLLKAAGVMHLCVAYIPRKTLCKDDPVYHPYSMHNLPLVHVTCLRCLTIYARGSVVLTTNGDLVRKADLISVRADDFHAPA